jgi:hypothetical protein
MPPLLSRCPGDVELDVPTELGSKLALKYEEGDPIVAWVPRPVTLTEDTAQRVNSRFPERHPVSPRREPESDRELDRAGSCRRVVHADGVRNRSLPLSLLG